MVSGVEDEDQLLEASLEGGAEFYEMSEDDMAEVFTEMSNLEVLGQRLRDTGFQVDDVELRWIPSNYIEVVDFEQGRSLVKLIDSLEGLDDVQNVTANFDMADSVLELLV